MGKAEQRAKLVQEEQQKKMKERYDAFMEAYDSLVKEHKLKFVPMLDFRPTGIIAINRVIEVPNESAENVE